jgi:hypothetical protein
MAWVAMHKIVASRELQSARWSDIYDRMAPSWAKFVEELIKRPGFKKDLAGLVSRASKGEASWEELLDLAKSYGKTDWRTISLAALYLYGEGLDQHGAHLETSPNPRFLSQILVTRKASMHKIASPNELQAELRRLLAYSQSPKPSRVRLAAEMRELADRVAGVPEELTHRLSPAEVSRLPVGSIVWSVIRDDHAGPFGRVDGSPLIVIPSGDLTPIANLPERVGGSEPGGDPANAFGREFVVVSKGHGKLLTNGAAKRLAFAWQRENQA